MEHSLSLIAILPIILTGLMVAFAHAALPTHWLPFVIAGKGQGWGKSKTLFVTALASLGHVFFTTILGFVVVFLGIQAETWFGHTFHLFAGCVLIGFGFFYLVKYKLGKSSHHHHHHDQENVPNKSDRAIIIGLLVMLTFSPCEGFLPVYISGIQYGWFGFILLSSVLGLATLGGMLFFTWLTLKGLDHVHVHALEKYETAILGTLLVALGLIMLFA
ncbi:MAG: hypothetical protein DI586_07760 [Micavibrio aeruginosavorus]|uniref:Urease accessory protein UreH-like transmembrane domain-containing protein n=1 Tax=Micavibrio aeruginosavorus TaxID=349221 RepID=A0A2W5HHN2_9BACT|nr:MAG: hypothetical protein DI586_07760 [Micavibrio aeruginosavorus]